MYMLEIVALENGAHNNQTYHGTLPEGWAVIREDISALKNFPFGDVTAEEIDGVMTVTSWTPGVIPEDEPEPEPEPEPVPTIEERVTTLEESNAELTEALEMILTGVTE